MFEDGVWQAMFRHAQDDYPKECCGIITENANGQYAVHRCDNIQDKLHSADPKAHPRTSEKAYRMDDMQVMLLQMEAEKTGGRMAAIYHSHIDVDAYFSQEDQQAALFFGEPAYPWVVYPVIPVKNGRVDQLGKKIFKWQDASSAFEEVV